MMSVGDFHQQSGWYDSGFRFPFRNPYFVISPCQRCRTWLPGISQMPLSAYCRRESSSQACSARSSP
jgi:hypothetical protein